MTKKKTTTKTTLDLPNWEFEGKEMIDSSEAPQGAIGFIYKITDLTNNRYYIGRKMLTSTRGRGKKAVVKESDWKKYHGSNKELKTLVKSGIKIKREILVFGFSKTEMTYLETKEIICSGALEDENSYNGWVKATIYKKTLINK